MNLNLRNNRATYYSVKNNIVRNYEPSFVLELEYFNKKLNDSRIDEIINSQLEFLIIEKPLKIQRQTKLKINQIEERLYRCLVNRDKYHTFKLANELMLRDKNRLYNILYSLSFIAEDENKLIKTYLFEHITENSEYNPILLYNLIKYFITSCPKYMDLNDKNQAKYFYSIITKLYILIYNRKCTEYKHNKLQIDSNNELSNQKQIIYDILLKGVM